MKVERNLKKKSLILFFIAALALAAVGCGNKTSYLIDEEDFMSQLVDSVKFDCEMYQVKEDGIGNFFTFEEDVNAVMYMGSGAYADTAGIFTAADEESAKRVLETVKQYTEDLIHSFEDYIPEEVNKIENGIAEQKGKYVVLCISADSEEARTFIDSYFEDRKGSDKNDEEGEKKDNSQQNGQKENEDQADPEGETSKEPDSQYPSIEMKGKMQDYGNVISVGDTAYELYSYTEGTAKKYADIINQTAKKLEGKTRVFDLLIPLSSGITLPDELYDKISSTNQKNALKKIEQLMDQNVKVINPYENLMAHRDEYIYFRTDHHWTADGAYYAYEALCKAAGLVRIPREDHKTDTFEGFIGSFYKDTNQNKKLGENPDSIKVYYPISENTSLKYTTTEGKTNSWKVIWDVESYGASMKYSTFIAGDNPFTKIENEDLKDGSSCVVVKESFGNALVPFLVDHYEKIYVIDYRYWQGDLTEFASENNIDDLYFFNNLSMIRSDYLVGKLAQIV